uniref:Methionine aminopeptidase n=1 Tax=candidate division CPR3 bacterium TaxID=2268181 RepID=A0A7C5UUD5_UNCC3
MNVIPKTTKEINRMIEGGKMLALIVKDLLSFVQVGVRCDLIDKKAKELCEKYKVKPAFLNYEMDGKKYPSYVCVCINEEVVHGIPSQNKVIENGDIVTVDMGIIYKGLYLDMARTIGVGKISSVSRNVIKASENALISAIKKCRPGNLLSDVSRAIYNTARKYKCKPMIELVGHGIGKALHEDPSIPGYWIESVYEDLVLKKGMTFAVESIITSGKDITVEISKEDGWTTWPKDKALTAVFEDTIVVSDPPVVLTAFKNFLK